MPATFFSIYDLVVVIFMRKTERNKGWCDCVKRGQNRGGFLEPRQPPDNQS